jgi:hypothetical protein
VHEEETASYTKCGIDTTLGVKLAPERALGGGWVHLGSDGMTSGGEKLGDTSSLEPGLGKTESTSQSSTASTTVFKINGEPAHGHRKKISHNHGVILVLNERVFTRRPRLEIRWVRKRKQEKDGTCETEYLDFWVCCNDSGNGGRGVEGAFCTGHGPRKSFVDHSGGGDG